MQEPTQTTDIIVVLDRSGSMQTIREETVAAFNRFLEDQRQQPGEAALTLVQFDDEIETIYAASPLEDVPDLTQQRFVPRGMTALLDAIGQTIEETVARHAQQPKTDTPRQAVFAILTDGAENASQRYDKNKVFSLITQQRKADWQFLFLGADADTIATAASYGIDRDSSIRFAASSKGINDAMTRMSSLTSRFRSRPRQSS